MKHIKTITGTCPEIFDREVNNAIDAGWELVKRHMDLDRNDPLYIAEMEREVPDRRCETCRYYFLEICQEPCSSCEDVNGVPDKWERANP